MIKIEEICQSYAKNVGDSKEIFPAPGAILHTNGSLLILSLTLPEKKVVDYAYSLCRDPKVIEFFFAFDLHNLPIRAQTFHSVLAVFHVRKGEPARLGVIEYGWDTDLIMEPLVWGDEFWSAKYGLLLAHLTKQSGGGSAGYWDNPRSAMLN